MKELKLTPVIFVGGNNFILNFLCKNGPKIGLNWGFWSIIKSQCMEIFKFFPWSYNNISTYETNNETKWFFEENFDLKLMGHEWPLIGPN